MTKYFLADHKKEVWKMGIPKTALVMGGTSGIGLGAAYGLDRLGVKTIISGRDLARAEKIAESISPHSSAIAIDLSQPESYVSILQALDTPIDILIANGPGFSPGSILDAKEQDFCLGFDTMFRSIVSIINQLLPGMCERKWGRIVYISSSSVISPIPELAVSSVIRAALNSYLKLLASSVAAEGVTVNSVLPGKIDTPRLEQVDKALAQALAISPEILRENSAKTIPMQRYGMPEEIGSLIAYLASDSASYITGSTFRCDGGLIQAL